MKKFFLKIGSWFSSFFKSKKVEVKEVEKTHEQLLFEDLMKKGFFKDNKSSREEILKDLSQSAKKLNYYKISNAGRSIRPSDELHGQILGEEAKDKTTLKRQEIIARKRDEKLQANKVENIDPRPIAYLIKGPDNNE